MVPRVHRHVWSALFLLATNKTSVKSPFSASLSKYFKMRENVTFIGLHFLSMFHAPFSPCLSCNIKAIFHFTLVQHMFFISCNAFYPNEPVVDLR